MERLYIVRCDCSQWHNLFIVKAANKIEAINLVYDEQFAWHKEVDRAKGYTPVYKSDLSAKPLDEEFAEYKQQSVCLY